MVTDFARRDKNSKNIKLLKDIVFGDVKKLEYKGLKPLNQKAQNAKQIEGLITGGNLMLLQSSIGRSWQLDAKNKILIIEEIAEKGYRVDRMLHHLKDAGILKNTRAIILGDFILSSEDSNREQMSYVLQNFADGIDIPVYKTDLFGHGKNNYPFVIGSQATVKAEGQNATLTMEFSWE